MEVLRGCRANRQNERALKVLSALECATLGGRPIAVKAAQHFGP